ncbi:HNH endonuclease [Pseudarthrobacter sp. R1]|uniref:HNH endonuclease signature motif containing protein n=1 Tax=Pseudarthrobacter sp. R1 TaxID=2944934 RepID=UPI00210EED2A|nr:HNH endonuclease signature motif containing protein [Pseudarthrobacter sp. R1]MCQ6269544.1 HNH endonuclease [Pseudarthrobacter sp. R1]
MAVLAGSDVAVSGGPGELDAGAGPHAAAGFDDDPLQRVADGALDVLAAVARSEAKLAAAKVQAVAVFAEATKALNAPARSPYEATAQERSLVAEIGCVLAIGDRAAGALLADSHALTTFLPGTLSALQAGAMSWAHARAMVDQTASLDPAGAAALEAHFLDPVLDPGTPRPAAAAAVGEMPAYRFKAKARAWRERHHPESLEKRHAKSVADRRVEFWPDNDGMGWIAACLPADQASAIWDRLTTISREMQGPDEPRTLTQLRADNFASGLLTTGPGISAGNSPSNGGNSFGNGAGDGFGNGGANSARSAGGGGEETGPGQGSSIRAQVLVTVPVFSLLGLTDEPAMLDGSGPIPASMARDLVGNGAGSFYRVLVDPRDGAPLEIGRTSYRLTKAMRNWLRLRDGKCPFPGCSNNSLDNEADHILAWHKGGTTGISNLGQPCPKHHKLRHTGGWKPTPATTTEPPGWTSPTGRHYKSEHQDWEPPHWPKRIEELWDASLQADSEPSDLYVPGYFALPETLDRQEDPDPRNILICQILMFRKTLALLKTNCPRTRFRSGTSGWKRLPQRTRTGGPAAARGTRRQPKDWQSRASLHPPHA